MTLDLDKLRALAAAATPGPWFFTYSRIVSEPRLREYDAIERTFPDDIGDDDPRWGALPEPNVAYVTPSFGDTATDQCAADAAFIAAARDAVPALCDEVERLRGALAKANAGFEKYEREFYLASHRAEDAEAERDALRDGLRWALNDLDEAWPYAGDYFEDKWRDLARENELRALVGMEPVANERRDPVRPDEIAAATRKEPDHG